MESGKPSRSRRRTASTRIEDPELYLQQFKKALLCLSAIDKCLALLRSQNDPDASHIASKVQAERDEALRKDGAWRDAHNHLGLLVGVTSKALPPHAPAEDQPSDMRTAILRVLARSSGPLTSEWVADGVDAMHPGRWELSSIRSMTTKMARDGEIQRSGPTRGPFEFSLKP